MWFNVPVQTSYISNLSILKSVLSQILLSTVTCNYWCDAIYSTWIQFIDSFQYILHAVVTKSVTAVFTKSEKIMEAAPN